MNWELIETFDDRAQQMTFYEWHLLYEPHEWVETDADVFRLACFGPETLGVRRQLIAAQFSTRSLAFHSQKYTPWEQYQMGWACAVVKRWVDNGEAFDFQPRANRPHS